MNRGAFVYAEKFLNEAEIAQAADLADAMESQRKAVHELGKYADLRWFQVPLDPKWPVAAKMLAELHAGDPEILVFYYLEPGAVLHPHRDLTGASMNDRIRFHIPIRTNDRVDFMVGGKKVKMRPGDLWCLDTSYLHSVRNDGDETRIHMIVECKISPEVRKRLPSDLPAKIHNVYYMVILGGRFLQSVVVNVVKDPAYFRNQMGMVWDFIGWRFLGKKPPVPHPDQGAQEVTGAVTP